MDTVNEYLKANATFTLVNGKIPYPTPIKHIVCKDGFTMSVQVGDCLYCHPRKNFAWPYDEVEIGYPNQKEELLVPYSDGWDEGVFSYVPIGIANEIVEKHGGICDA